MIKFIFICSAPNCDVSKIYIPSTNDGVLEIKRYKCLKHPEYEMELIYDRP